MSQIIKIGEKIKELRESRQMSQNEIAKLLGLHRPAISEIERGNREVTIEELIKLTEFFNIKLETLLSEPIKKNSVKSDQKYKTILFIRHTEASDDVYNQYGGWGDPDLSTRGISIAQQVALSLKNSEHNYEIIYTSPLLRAKRVAEIIANEINLNIEVLQYLKERNTYGLLSGLNKDVAKIKYPELVKSYEKGEYVLASERTEDFQERLKLIFKHINSCKYNNVICVTHGKVLNDIFNLFMEKRVDSFEDGCKILLHLEGEKIKLISSTGVNFKI